MDVSRVTWHPVAAGRCDRVLWRLLLTAGTLSANVISVHVYDGAFQFRKVLNSEPWSVQALPAVKQEQTVRPSAAALGSSFCTDFGAKNTPGKQYLSTQLGNKKQLKKYIYINDITMGTYSGLKHYWIGTMQ